MDDSLPAFTSWLEEWKLELSAGRPSEHTIKFYSLYVRQFLTWLRKAKPDVVRPDQLEWQHIRDWAIWQVEDGKAEATRRVRSIAVRKWLGYIASQPDSGMPTNPALGLELPMPKVPPVPVVSDGDISNLLKSMAGNDFRDRRDTSIIRLLWDTGIRRAELAGINVSEVDLQYQQMMVHGKGGYDRIVPFGGRTTLALRKYLRSRSVMPGAASAALLLSVRPHGLDDWRLTGGAIREMVRARCQQAGLPGFYPHQLRHTWAADMKANGMSDSDVERLAGWRTPMMVRRYGSAVADQQARDAARRLARGDRV